MPDKVVELPTSLRIAVQPAIKWLCENANPYSYILITSVGAELLSSEQMVSTEQYILEDEEAFKN